MKSNAEGISIVIPVFNEELVVGDVLRTLCAACDGAGLVYEIIAVNDGSTDSTKEVLAKIEGIVVVDHPHNRGYGAALKTGVTHARHDWVATYDADGQHTPEHILALLEHRNGSAMVVGSRKGYRGPLMRQPGKWLLSRVANYLVDTHIPDLNSGLRLVQKSEFAKFAHLYPSGFSLSTTITLAFLKSGLAVSYVPISIQERIGKGTVRPKDALKTLALIFRIVTLFSPLRVFLPLTTFLGILTFVSFGNDLMTENLTDTTILLFLATLILFSFGVTLDHVAAIRRELHRI